MVHPSAPHDAPAAVRNAREASLQVKGSRLFNLIPLELRAMSGTVLQFKNGLDSWLSDVLDQPTISSNKLLVRPGAFAPAFVVLTSYILFDLQLVDDG